jgi:hypothetical protein
MALSKKFYIRVLEADNENEVLPLTPKEFKDESLVEDEDEIEFYECAITGKFLATRESKIVITKIG